MLTSDQLSTLSTARLRRSLTMWLLVLQQTLRVRHSTETRLSHGSPLPAQTSGVTSHTTCLVSTRCSWISQAVWFWKRVFLLWIPNPLRTCPQQSDFTICSFLLTPSLLMTSRLRSLTTDDIRWRTSPPSTDEWRISLKLCHWLSLS